MAHGQPSEPAPPEATLAGLARQVARHLPGWLVRSATLAMPGRLEHAAADLADGAVIYPFFMAKGWFVTGALPRRLGDRRLVVAEPLGLEPDLPIVAAQAVQDAARARAVAVDGLRLLLAAHGSGRGPAAATAANDFAARLRPLLGECDIATGFVEQSPGIAESARGMGSAALCLPFFALPGDHVRRDIPQALAQAGFRGELLPVLGMQAGIPGLIAASLRRAQSDGAA